MSPWTKRLLIAGGGLVGLLMLFGSVVTVVYGKPRAFRAATCAMAPAVEAGDRVVLRGKNKTGTIKRGHIVVFHPPAPFREGEDDTRISRVVAVGGDTLEIKDGALWVNGKAADEPYLAKGTQTLGPPGPLSVPKGSYFMMGDYRGGSQDSRFYGAVARSDIVGRRLWVIGFGGGDCPSRIG